MTTEELYEKSDGVVMQLLRLIFFAAGWPELVETNSSLEALVLQGYNFNYWARPSKLKI